MARALGTSTSHFTLLISIYTHFVTGQHFGEWLPIPNDVALKRFNINAPRFIHRFDTTLGLQIEANAESAEVLKKDAIKLMEPPEVIGQFSVKRFELPDSIKKTQDLEPISGKCGNTGFETKCPEHKAEMKLNDIYMGKPTLINTRTAKKIEFEANVPGNVIEDLQQNQKETINTFNSDHEKIAHVPQQTIPEETHSYAVTESSDLGEDSASSTFDFIKSSGYSYNRPIRFKNHTQTNFTQNLFQILNKYNIHKQDRLPNYAKSRITDNVQAINTKIIYLPIPLKALERSNSLNHLPVDPLVAVFLSNYGYYLPNSYGPRNNYRNIYGYLASNNIHNNKPFGMYKIFSDTDSSSK